MILAQNEWIIRKIVKKAKIMRMFTEHPQSVDESYGEHMVFANKFGFRMILGGLACCLHGIFPSILKCKGSETVMSLHSELQAHRTQLFHDCD